MPVYSEQPPAAAFNRWVECGWFLQSAEAVTAHPVPPDGCVDIVYGRGSGSSSLQAIGTMTVQQLYDYPHGAFLTGVRFRPGMAGSLLGLSPAELTDRSVPLDEIWRGRGAELARRLDDARFIRDAMRILLGSLPPPATPNPAQQAIEALATANGNADLESAARQANLSPRQFRRRCLEESGLTPKRLCRVLRFRHACSIAGSMDRLNWSDIALEAEYFDQAHLIRDFQQFTGHTPMSVFSNTGGRRSG